MKPSIVFVVYSMNVGGVEKALLGVVGRYLAEGWEVHVALLRKQGGFLPYLPAEVVVHEIKGWDQVRPMLHRPPRQVIAEALRKGHFGTAFTQLRCYAMLKLTGGNVSLYKHYLKRMPQLSDHTFDVAVAFAGPDSLIDWYVHSHIRAREKWGWIHFDISKFGCDPGIVRKVYGGFERVNVVSEAGKAIFDARFPRLAAKTRFVPNIVDEAAVLRMAKEGGADAVKPVGRRVVLTVGRLSPEKGQRLALEAFAAVAADCPDVDYWLVGAGVDEEPCRRFVAERGLSDRVRFLGAQANPYPYMAAADVYVQPSVHEGYCITLAEAKLFGMPIVATDFTGAREQLDVYGHPHAVVAHAAAALAAALRKFLEYKDL